MRERTPSADDTPKRAPPAPPREAVSTHITGGKTSPDAVELFRTWKLPSASTSSIGPSKMVASTHNLEDLNVNHPANASNNRQEQQQQQQQEKHGQNCKTPQTVQDKKRSRLSNVINNLNLKKKDNLKKSDSPKDNSKKSDSPKKDNLKKTDSPKKDEDGRNSVERNLEILEKYIMTVLNGVDEEEGNEHVTERKETECAQEKQEKQETRADDENRGTEDAKTSAVGVEPSKPKESRTEEAVPPGETEPVLTKNSTRDVDEVDDSCRQDPTTSQRENDPKLLLEVTEEPSADTTKRKDSAKTDKKQAERDEGLGKSSAKESSVDRSVGKVETHRQVPEEKMENRSLGTIILERLNDHQASEETSSATSNLEERGGGNIPEHSDLRTICRDLLNDLLNGLNQPVGGSLVGDSATSESSKTSLHCSLPLDKVASVLQNCQTSELVCSQSTSSSSVQASENDSVRVWSPSYSVQRSPTTSISSSTSSPSSSSSVRRQSPSVEDRPVPTTPTSQCSSAIKSPAKPPSPTVRHLCLYCDRKFISISLRQRHTERVHQLGGGRRSERNSRKPSQNCQYCSDKCAENLEGLFQHMVGSHSDKYHACVQCSTRYLTKEALVDHVNETHGSTTDRSQPSQEKGKEPSPCKDFGSPTSREKVETVSTADRISDETETETRAETSLHKYISPSTKDTFANPGSPEFDSTFYSSVSCNIRENLLHHLDGKLQTNPTVSSSTLSSPESKQQQQQQQQTPPQQQSFYEHSINQIQFPIDISLTAATPVYNKDYSNEEYENSSEYAQKPGKSSRSHPRRVSFEKYNFPRKYDTKEQWTCSIKDLSKFDISTQLSLRKKQQLIKERITLNRLQRLPALGQSRPGNLGLTDIELDRNEETVCPDHPEPSENNDGDKTIASSDTSSTKDVVTEESVDRPADVQQTADSSAKLTEFSAEFGNFMRLRRWEVGSNERANTEEVVYAELTGEWSRPRVYICGACNAKHVTLREMEDHKSSAHPNVWCSHFEFSGDQRELYKYLFLPGRSVPTAKAKNAVLTENVCTKCSKNCNSLSELHRHMLECGGDQAWLLGLFGNGKKKCKWRPFGSRSRSRRRRQRGMKRNIQNSQTPRVNVVRERQPPGPRVRPSDRESIQKMLANLPAKRTTRKVLQESTMRTQGRLRNVRSKSRSRIITESSSSRISRNKAALRNKLLKNAKSIQRNRCRSDNISAVIESVVRHCNDERKATLLRENKEDEVGGRERDETSSSNLTAKVTKNVKVLGKRRNVRTKDGAFRSFEQTRGREKSVNSKIKGKIVGRNVATYKRDMVDGKMPANLSADLSGVKAGKATSKMADKEPETSGSRSPISGQKIKSSPGTPKKKRPVDPVASLNASIKAKSQLRTQDGKFARNPNKDSTTPQKLVELKPPSSTARLNVKVPQNTENGASDSPVANSKGKTGWKAKNGDKKIPRRLTRLSSDSDKMPTLEPVPQLTVSSEESVEKSSGDLPILSPVSTAAGNFEQKNLRTSSKVSLSPKEDGDGRRKSLGEAESKNDGKEPQKPRRGRKKKEDKISQGNKDNRLSSSLSSAPKETEKEEKKRGRRSAPPKSLITDSDLSDAEDKTKRICRSSRSTGSSTDEIVTKKEKRTNVLAKGLQTRSLSRTRQDKRSDVMDEPIILPKVPLEVKKLLGPNIRADVNLLTTLGLQSQEATTKRILRQFPPKSAEPQRKESSSMIEANVESPQAGNAKTLIKRDKPTSSKKLSKSLEKKQDACEAENDSSKIDDTESLSSRINKIVEASSDQKVSSKRKNSANKEEANDEKISAGKSVECRNVETQNEKVGINENNENPENQVKDEEFEILNNGKTKETGASETNDIADELKTSGKSKAEKNEDVSSDKLNSSSDGNLPNEIAEKCTIDAECRNPVTISDQLQQEMSNSNIDSGKENSRESSVNGQRPKVGRPRRPWGSRKERAPKRSLNNVIGILTEGANIPLESPQSVVLTVQTSVEGTAGNLVNAQANPSQGQQDNSTASEVETDPDKPDDSASNRTANNDSERSNCDVEEKSPATDIILDLSRRKPKGKGSFLEKIVSKIAKQKDALLEGEVASLLDTAADELTSILDEVGPPLPENTDNSNVLDANVDTKDREKKDAIESNPQSLEANSSTKDKKNESKNEVKHNSVNICEEKKQKYPEECEMQIKINENANFTETPSNCTKDKTEKDSEEASKGKSKAAIKAANEEENSGCEINEKTLESMDNKVVENHSLAETKSALTAAENVSEKRQCDIVEESVKKSLFSEGITSTVPNDGDRGRLKKRSLESNSPKKNKRKGLSDTFNENIIPQELQLDDAVKLIGKQIISKNMDNSAQKPKDHIVDGEGAEEKVQSVKRKLIADEFETKNVLTDKCMASNADVTSINCRSSDEVDGPKKRKVDVKGTQDSGNEKELATAACLTKRKNKKKLRSEDKLHTAEKISTKMSVAEDAEECQSVRREKMSEKMVKDVHATMEDETLAATETSRHTLEERKSSDAIPSKYNHSVKAEDGIVLAKNKTEPEEDVADNSKNILEDGTAENSAEKQENKKNENVDAEGIGKKIEPEETEVVGELTKRKIRMKFQSDLTVRQTEEVLAKTSKRKSLPDEMASSIALSSVEIESRRDLQTTDASDNETLGKEHFNETKRKSSRRKTSATEVIENAQNEDGEKEDNDDLPIDSSTLVKKSLRDSEIVDQEVPVVSTSTKEEISTDSQSNESTIVADVPKVPKKRGRKKKSLADEHLLLPDDRPYQDSLSSARSKITAGPVTDNSVRITRKKALDDSRASSNEEFSETDNEKTLATYLEPFKIPEALKSSKKRTSKKWSLADEHLEIENSLTPKIEESSNSKPIKPQVDGEFENLTHLREASIESTGALPQAKTNDLLSSTEKLTEETKSDMKTITANLLNENVTTAGIPEDIVGPNSETKPLTLIVTKTGKKRGRKPKKDLLASKDDRTLEDSGRQEISGLNSSVVATSRRTRLSRRKQLSSDDQCSEIQEMTRGRSSSYRDDSLESRSSGDGESTDCHFPMEKMSSKRKRNGRKTVLDETETDTSITDVETPTVEKHDNSGKEIIMKHDTEKPSAEGSVDRETGKPENDPAEVENREELQQDETVLNDVSKIEEKHAVNDVLVEIQDGQDESESEVENEKEDGQAAVETGEEVEDKSDKEIRDESIHHEVDNSLGNSQKDEMVAENKTKGTVALSDPSTSRQPMATIDNSIVQGDFQTSKKRPTGNFAVAHTKSGEILIVEKKKKITKEAARFFCDVCATSFTRKSSLNKHYLSQSHVLQLQNNDPSSISIGIDKTKDLLAIGDEKTSEEFTDTDESLVLNRSSDPEKSLKETDENFAVTTDPIKSFIDTDATSQETLEDELLDEEICMITENMSHDEYVLTDHVSPLPETSQELAKKVDGKTQDAGKMKKKMEKKREKKKKNLASEHLDLNTPEPVKTHDGIDEVRSNDNDPEISSKIASKSNLISKEGIQHFSDESAPIDNHSSEKNSSHKKSKACQLENTVTEQQFVAEQSEKEVEEAETTNVPEVGINNVSEISKSKTLESLIEEVNKNSLSECNIPTVIDESRNLQVGEISSKNATDSNVMENDLSILPHDPNDLNASKNNLSSVKQAVREYKNFPESSVSDESHVPSTASSTTETQLLDRVNGKSDSLLNEKSFHSATAVLNLLEDGKPQQGIEDTLTYEGSTILVTEKHSVKEKKSPSALADVFDDTSEKLGPKENVHLDETKIVRPVEFESDDSSSNTNISADIQKLLDDPELTDSRKSQVIPNESSIEENKQESAFDKSTNEAQLGTDVSEIETSESGNTTPSKRSTQIKTKENQRKAKSTRDSAIKVGLFDAGNSDSMDHQPLGKKTPKKGRTACKETNKRTKSVRGKSRKVSTKSKIAGLSSESDDSENEDKLGSQKKSKIVKSVFGRVFGNEKPDKVKEVLNDWVSKSEDESDRSQIVPALKTDVNGEVNSTHKCTASLEKIKFSELSANGKRGSARTSNKLNGSSERSREGSSSSEDEEENEKLRNTRKRQKKEENRSLTSSKGHTEVALPSTRCRQSKKRAEERISRAFNDESPVPGEELASAKFQRTTRTKDVSYELRNQSKYGKECSSVDESVDEFDHELDSGSGKNKSLTFRRKKKKHAVDEWKGLNPQPEDTDSAKRVEDDTVDEECLTSNSLSAEDLRSKSRMTSPENSSFAPSSVRNRSPSLDRNTPTTQESENDGNSARLRMSPVFCASPPSSTRNTSNSEQEEETNDREDNEEDDREEIEEEEEEENNEDNDDEEEDDEEKEAISDNLCGKKGLSEFPGVKVVMRSPQQSSHKDRGEVVTITPTDAIEDNALDVPQGIESTKARQGKVLNFDEELFVECCSRLKATTENELRGAKKIKLDHSDSFHRKDDQQQNFRAARDRWRDVESQNSLGSLLESVNQLLGEEMYSSRERKEYTKRSVDERDSRSELSSRSVSPEASRIDNLGYEDSLDVAFEHNNKLRDKIQRRMRESEDLIANAFGQRAGEEQETGGNYSHQPRKDVLNSSENDTTQRNHAEHEQLDSSRFKGKINSALGGLLDKALSNLLHSNGKHDHNGSTPMKVLAELACARAPTSTSPLPGRYAPDKNISVTEKNDVRSLLELSGPTEPVDPCGQQKPSEPMSQLESKKPRNPIKELFERKKEINERKQQEKSKTEATLKELNAQRQRKTKKTKIRQEFPLIRRNEHGGLVERKKRRDGFARKDEFGADKIKDVYDFDEEESQTEPPTLGSVLSYRTKHEKNYEDGLGRKDVDLAKLMTKAIGDTLENGKTGDALGNKLESMIDRKFKEMEKFAPKTKGALKSFQVEEQRQKPVSGPMDEFVERKQRAKRIMGQSTKHAKIKRRGRNPRKKPKTAWYENDSSDEFRTAAKTEDVGVGISKSQRTCSKGKQNLFAELSTSSESEYDFDREVSYENLAETVQTSPQNPSEKTENQVETENTMDAEKLDCRYTPHKEHEEHLEDWGHLESENTTYKDESEGKQSESERSDGPLMIDEQKDRQRNNSDDEEADNQSEAVFELDDLYREDSSIAESSDTEERTAEPKADELEETEKTEYQRENELIPLEEALDLLDCPDKSSQRDSKSTDQTEDEKSITVPLNGSQNDDDSENKCQSSGEQDEEPNENLPELPEKLSTNEKPQKEPDNLPLHVFLSRKVQESKKRKQQELKKLQEEQERILLDFQPTRRQRKCAIGKQGLLAEISSSDDESYVRDTTRRISERSDHEKSRKQKKESKEKRNERYMEKKHEQMVAKEQKAIEEEILRELGKKKENQDSMDATSYAENSDEVNGEQTEEKHNPRTTEDKQKKKQLQKQSKPSTGGVRNSVSAREDFLSDSDNCDKGLPDSSAESAHPYIADTESSPKQKKHCKSSTKPKKLTKPDGKNTTIGKRNRNSNGEKPKSRSSSTHAKDSKERRSSNGKRDSDDEELKTTKSWNKVEEGVGVAIGRRKRAAANQLYYWSSSSDEEEVLPNEPAPVVEEEDDDRQEQHGWIVGDSHKKMITMLAMEKQLKEKRRRSEDEFESNKTKNKKHRNSTS